MKTKISRSILIGKVSVLLIFFQSTNIQAQQVNAYPFDFTDIAVSLTESVPKSWTNISLFVVNYETTTYKV